MELVVDADAGDSSFSIDEVRWTIRADGMTPMTGVIDTSAPGATASVEVFGLPPGAYRVELEAMGDDGATSCRGFAPFEVVPGVAAEVGVLLRCARVPELGGVRVNGTLNHCAALTKVVVAPLQTSVGYTIDVRAEAFDAEHDAIEYAWSASNGSFEEPSADATEYLCVQAGDDVLSITGSDDGFEHCKCTWSVDVHCVDDGAGGSGCL